jgi:hypothetical protein
MASIRINDKQIPLSSKIRFKWSSPLFSDMQPFSYSSTLPATPEVNAALGYAIYPEAKGNVEIPNIYFVCKHFEIKGTLYIKSTNTASYNFNFVANSITEQLKNFNLKDFTDVYHLVPADNFLGYDLAPTNEEIAASLVESLNGERDYVFAPVQTYKANEDNEIFPLMLSNNVIHSIMNNADLSYAQNWEVNNDRLWGWASWATPFFYTRAIIDKIFKKFNINCSVNAFKSEYDLSQLVVFNMMAINLFELQQNTNINSDVATITLEQNAKVTTVSSVYGLRNGDWVVFGISGNGGGMNALVYVFTKISDVEPFSFTTELDLTDYPAYTPSTGNKLYVNIAAVFSRYSDIILGRHLPAISAIEFISRLEKFLGITFDFGINGTDCKIVSLDEIVMSPIADDISNICTSNINIEHSQVDGFNLGYTADGEDRFFTEYVVDIKDGLNVKTPVDTLDELGSLNSTSAHNDLRLVNDANYWGAYYLFQKSIYVLKAAYITANNELKKYGSSIGEWVRYSFNFYGKKSGKQDINLVTDVGLIMWYDAPDPGEGFRSTILVGNKQNYYSFPIETQSTALRMFFYRGFHYNRENGELLPLSTCGVIDHKGDKIPNANLELRYDGKYSIYERRYKNWINWLLTCRDVKAQIQWPEAAVINFDFLKKRSINGNVCLIKSIEFELDPVDDSIDWKETELSVG